MGAGHTVMWFLLLWLRPGSPGQAQRNSVLLPVAYLGACEVDFDFCQIFLLMQFFFEGVELLVYMVFTFGLHWWRAGRFSLFGFLVEWHFFEFLFLGAATVRLFVPWCEAD
jgi:hypothetical protein